MKNGRKLRFAQLERDRGYKIVLSMISGVLCFFGASFAIQSGLSLIITVAWGILFLLLVALTWWEKSGRRPEAEELLRANEIKYRNVFENIHDLYVETTLDGTIAVIAPSVKEILGYSAEELIGTDITDIYFDGEKRAQTINAVLGRKKIENYGIALRHKNGQKRDLLLNLKVGTDGNGQMRLIGGARDVTQYLEASARQEESEKNYKQLFGKMLNGFIVIEPVFDEKRKLSDIRFAEVNPAFETQTAEKAGDVAGKTWYEVCGFRNRCLEIYERVFLTGLSQSFESHIPELKNGSFSANAFLIAENRVGVLFNNITGRVKAERELKLSEEKYRNIFENIRDLYYEAYPDGEILEVSPSVRHILGYGPEEVVGRNIAMLYPEPEIIKKAIDKILADEKIDNFELIIKTKDGIEKTLWLNAHAIADTSGKQKVAGIARDVTEHLATMAKQKETENELKRLTDNLETIIESTDDMIWSVDADFRIVYSNTAMRRHMKSNYNTAFGPGVHTGDAFPPKLAEVWTRYYERVLREGRYLVEYETSKGNKYLDVSFNPIYKDGKVTEISVFAKDITQRKLAEREIMKLNAGLERRVAKRTAELQTAVSELEAFTYTVSHDLKSPLRAMEAYSRILLEDYPQHAEDEIGEIAGNIKNISRDMIALINKLLQYSTTVRLEINKESVDVGELAGMIFNELTSAIPERDIKLVMEPELPRVKADKVLLKQVLYNVVSNAVKFTKTRDTAVINVGYTIEKDEAVFSIKDNGVGFDAESAGKLFGIFQRLHSLDEFEGTGIGLATVRKIIQKHGGRTWIEGKRDQGATVFFTLPLSEEQLPG